MRKILTKQEQERKTKLMVAILGLILIGLMVFSTLGYALGSKDEDSKNKKIVYNEIEFIQDNSEYWYFNVQEQNFATKYNPKQVENISFSSYLNFNTYVGNPLYFIGEGEGIYEISRNLNEFVLRMQNACLLEEDCENDFPIKNCSVDNIIIIQEPEEDGSETIYQEENCVFIISSLENQTMYADAFLFGILGI